MARVKSKKYDGVYINKLLNGDTSYYITYKDENNNLKWFKVGTNKKGDNTFTETYCNTKRNEYINKINLGEDPQAKKKKKDIITFDSIAKKFFDSVEGINRDNKNSIARYKLHIMPFIGKMDISSISYKEIEAIQKTKQKTHSPKTVNHITTLVGTIFNYAIKKEDMKLISPLQKIDNLKIDNKRERFLSIKEIKDLLAEVSTDETLNLFTRLSLSTGGRASTIMNIKKKDVDIENHTINLFDFKNQTSYKGFITNDLIPIFEQLLPQLKINDLLISTYVMDTIQHKMKAILDNLFNVGLEAIDSKNRAVTHTLRHTFASQLAMAGTPIFTIQKLMNHKDINMTLRYAKLAPDNGKIEVQGLYQ